jgi:hypothetical protein
VTILTSADDMLGVALTDAYVYETDRTVFGFFRSDLSGLVLERTASPSLAEDFEDADFEEDDPLYYAARDVSLLVVKRDYTDYKGRSRPADILFLQTTGAGNADEDLKTNPIIRALYCLCVDNGDGDHSNDPAVILPDTVCRKKTRLSLLRCVWYSRNSFSRLELPDGDTDAKQPEETLLVEDVVAIEIRVMSADVDGFERRTAVVPDVEDEKIIAVQVVLTVIEPGTGEERELVEILNLADVECY